MYDSTYDSGRQSPSPHPKKEKNAKRPWLTSSRPDSFNRKYGATSGDLFNEFWRSKPKLRDLSPPTSARNGSTISISGNNRQRSVSPKRPKTPSSPQSRHQHKNNHLEKPSEVLQKVTTLSSSLDGSQQSSRIGREESFIVKRKGSSNGIPTKRSFTDTGSRDRQGSNGNFHSVFLLDF